VTGSLEQTVALVTGAGGGIGSAICVALAEAGATVIGADLPTIPAERHPPAIGSTSMSPARRAGMRAWPRSARATVGSTSSSIMPASIASSGSRI
jgi:NAD(P)-dependent dehydrogenase (short-subunit alcohol dehydrogenase family)